MGAYEGPILSLANDMLWIWEWQDRRHSGRQSTFTGTSAPVHQHIWLRSAVMSIQVGFVAMPSTYWYTVAPNNVPPRPHRQWVTGEGFSQNVMCQTQDSAKQGRRTQGFMYTVQCVCRQLVTQQQHKSVWLLPGDPHKGRTELWRNSQVKVEWEWSLRATRRR